MKRLLGVILVLALALGLVAAVWAGWRGAPSERERGHVLRVGYSHPEITGRVGAVRNVTVAVKRDGVPFGKRPQDWSRTVAGEAVVGEVRLAILGTTEGGFVTLAYTFRENDERFTVVRLDTSALGPLPNEASEPRH